MADGKLFEVVQKELLVHAWVKAGKRPMRTGGHLDLIPVQLSRSAAMGDDCETLTIGHPKESDDAMLKDVSHPTRLQVGHP